MGTNKILIMPITEVEWRKYSEKQYPLGKISQKRKIVRCSKPDTAWYKDMIGQVVDVHYFVTFGAWTTDGKYIDYYDLSNPL